MKDLPFVMLLSDPTHSRMYSQSSESFAHPPAIIAIPAAPQPTQAIANAIVRIEALSFTR